MLVWIKILVWISKDVERVLGLSLRLSLSLGGAGSMLIWASLSHAPVQSESGPRGKRFGK